MRIGVYCGKTIFSDAQAGGAYTFQKSIVQALYDIQSEHEIFIFSDDVLEGQQGAVRFVRLDRYHAQKNENVAQRLLLKIPRKIQRIRLEKEFVSPLNKAVLENCIELMWFVTPAYEYVEVPFIYTVWDLQHRLQSYFPEVSVTGWKFEDREKRYGFVLPRAAFIITGNQAGKNEIIKFYAIPEQRVKIIPMPVPNFVFDQGPLDKQVKQSLPTPYIFYPAQFWPHKNHIVILLALKILKERYNISLHVVFTGSDKGNLQYIKETVTKLGLKDNVVFSGFVSVEALIHLYKNALALVLPSFFGPDNIPPLEAFALGCPVIAAKVAGSEYQLEGAALLFDPKDERALAEHIKKLYENQGLRESLVTKGKDKVAGLTAQNYVKSLLALVDEFGPIRRCWSNLKPYRQV
jgi:glycosyltransferase involved in cell wall biosynthesis